MKIHEFLSEFRDEVCVACVRNLQRGGDGGSEEELSQHSRVFIEQIIQRLRKGDGLPEELRVPELRLTAATRGHEVHARGLPIESAARSFAMLSVSLGEVAGRYDFAFDAGEYRSFSEAIDEGVAAAIEQFAKDSDAEHVAANGRSVGFLAHELRSAITSAKLALGVLERSPDGPCDRMRQIHRSLDRMDKLVERTLVDVRLTGAPPPPLRALLVAPLLRDVESECILERRIRLAVETDESLVAFAEEQLLAVAIGNIVRNAIKYSRDDAVVTLRARGEPGAIVVEVEDECGGLPIGAVEQIFKPFVRQRSDRQGFGLGLAITRRAADALSATVVVHDLPGKGCLFALRLRAASDVESGAALRCAPPDGDGEELATTQTTR